MRNTIKVVIVAALLSVSQACQAGGLNWKQVPQDSPYISHGSYGAFGSSASMISGVFPSKRASIHLMDGKKDTGYAIGLSPPQASCRYEMIDPDGRVENCCDIDACGRILEARYLNDTL